LNFLRKVYGVYGLVVITLIIASIVPMYFVVFLTARNRNAADRRGHAISRNASRVLFLLYGMRVRVTGREILNPRQSYVFVFNHSSLLDVPACTLATNHTFKFLAKAELAKVPLFGYIVRNLYLTVKRGSPEDRARSIAKMNESLNRGVSILIYPEGTRNRTAEPLGPLYDGAFKLSRETNTPIAVGSIIGSKRLLNNTELQPGTMKISWQGIVAPQPGDTVETLKEKTRVLLLEGIRQG
jgi:1-acyl-sn-glycerol-3-phosphate acyltransferase